MLALFLLVGLDLDFRLGIGATSSDDEDRKTLIFFNLGPNVRLLLSNLPLGFQLGTRYMKYSTTATLPGPMGGTTELRDEFIPIYAGPVYLVSEGQSVSLVFGANLCVDIYTTTFQDAFGNENTTGDVFLGLFFPVEARTRLGPPVGTKALLSLGTGLHLLFWDGPNYMVPIEVGVGISF